MQRRFLLLLLLTCAGCAAEDYYQAGKAYEGLQPLAALEYYRLCLEADSEHSPAKTAAESHHYATITPLLERAAAKGNAGEWVDAVGLVEQAVAVAAVLELEFRSPPDPAVEERYAEALKQAGQQRYEEGEALRQRDKAKEASVAYREALAFDPKHAQAEARYDEQRAAATHRVAVMPFACDLPQQPNAGRALSDEVTAQALALNPEFLRFVDRNHLDRLLDEMDLTETGLIDPETAAKEGKLLGVTAIVLGEVTVTAEDSGWQETPKENTAKIEVDDVTGVKRKEEVRANYTVHERTVTSNVTVTYRVISAESGEVLTAASGLLQQDRDQVRYARITQGRAEAVPKAERALLEAPEREPKTIEELTRAALVDVGAVVAADLVRRFE